MRIDDIFPTIKSNELRRVVMALRADIARVDPLSQSFKDIRPLCEVKREAIEHAIRLCDGNVKQAARRLGVGVATIYRLAPRRQYRRP